LVNLSSYRENTKVAAMLPLSATTKEAKVSSEACGAT